MKQESKLHSFPKLRKKNTTIGLFGRIRLHPFFILLFLLAWYAGLLLDLFILFLLVILHEIGHAAVANYLGYEVEEVSLLPFGGVAKLTYGDLGFQPRHEAAVAIAGPFVNFILILFAFIFNQIGIWSQNFYHLVFQLNLWIAIFNLLPAMPLDGGRILRAARSRRIGYDAATREAYRLAFILSFLMLGIGLIALWVGHPHLGMLMLGTFLFVSAWTGRRGQRVDTIRFLDAKRRWKSNHPKEIRSLAAQGQTTVRDIVQRFAPDRYHMIYVLSENQDISAVIEENEVLEEVFAGGWLTPIQDLIDHTEK